MKKKYLGYRNLLAEKGVEMTPAQAKETFETCEALNAAIDYETYLLLINRTPEDVIEWGRKFGSPPEEAKKLHELLVHAAKRKYES